MVNQRIPEETIQEVLHRIDIADVIGSYVQLTQRGASMKGLCPFHNEKTPSFTVNPAKGVFYCFGCQVGGNVVSFVMQHDNLTFPEAVRLLADRYGVPIPEAQTAKQPSTWQQLYRLHEAAAAFFQKCLLQDSAAQQARAYCRQRQLTGEVMSRFGLGYAPNTWESLWREMQRQGFSQELMIQSGLVAAAREARRGVYDRFRHRLMFPITDRQGRPVAFGGRILDGADASQAPKYLNSPETPIFHKGRTLYGFHLATQAIRQHGCAILVEGYTDVVACHRQGVAHAVGTLGTALTTSHVEMLRGLVKEVVLIFDADTAGGTATERGIGLLLDAGMRVRVVELPEGEDPASFLQQHSGADFLRRVEEGQSFLEYLVRRAKRAPDFHTPTGQADCVAHIVPLLHKIDDHVERWGYMALLAEQLGLPPEILQRQMQPTRDGETRRWGDPATGRGRAKETGRPQSYPPTSATSLPRLIAASKNPQSAPREEYCLIQELCHDLRFLTRVQQQITADAFGDEDLRAIYVTLVQLAPECQGAAFSQLLHAINQPRQRQLVSQMAIESFVSSEDERAKAVDDCLTKMQRRHMKAQRQCVIDQLHTASDEVKRQLLQEFRRLQQQGRVGGKGAVKPVS